MGSQQQQERKWVWAFSIIVICQAVACLALEGFVFGKFQLSLSPDARASDFPATRAVPTYMALLIFAFIYQLILAYDALRHKNTIQIIGICLYDLGILVYTGIQIEQVHDAVKDLAAADMIRPDFWKQVRAPLVAVSVIMVVCLVLLIVTAYKLYEYFAWQIYKEISADVKMKRRYLMYQIYIALLKFDFFFFLGFTVQFLVVVTNTTDLEFILTIIAIPVTFVIIGLAVVFVRREMLYGQIFIIFIWFASMAYFLFKLIRMYGANYHRKADYMPVRKSLTVFAVITLVLLMITIIVACVCAWNFNHGLREHLTRTKSKSNETQKLTADSSSSSPKKLEAGTAKSRMTID